MDELLKKLLRFRKDRDWEQFHSPKNLAEAIVIESSELLEQFIWNDKTTGKNISEEKRKSIESELADVVIFLMYLSHDLGINMKKAVRNKILVNENRYSVEKAKGNSTKYTELEK